MAFLAGQRATAAQLNDQNAKGISLIADGLTSPQSFATGSTTTVQWPVIDSSESSIITITGTNNTTFTVVKPGFFAIETALRLVAGTTTLELSIKVNGVRVGANVGNTVTSTARNLRLVAGDVITITAIHSSGSTKAVESGAEDTSHVSITRLSE
ncbi:hypothetical protein DMH01_03270 [Amycolatopsis sp. WAC 04182]|uniref:hypothetical protein n=1 Tax=Amycolatopsis sp. WAC 04182 TaxID=2203198 RepID=UPI000F7B59D5|nr:hypothetical protein [Amycolatopsis sp. WAC 04182]RSN65411.1 hypothetical protein DMH01_03270 [Amycolatopsis sp. WAC 04182]